MDQISFADRRSLPRLPLTRTITLRSPERIFAATTGITKNVSGSGIFVLVPSRIAVGTAVELLFEMPAAVGDNSYSVLCTGTVVRLEPASDQFGIAVAFKSIEVAGQA